MIIDKYFHLYGEKDSVNFVEIPKPTEPKKGRWIYEYFLLECSECGYQRDSRDNEGIPIPDNFCANCGARMKGDTE